MFSGRDGVFVDQGEPRGTGHAVLAVREAVVSGTFLVLPGMFRLSPQTPCARSFGSIESNKPRLELPRYRGQVRA